MYSVDIPPPHITNAKANKCIRLNTSGHIIYINRCQGGGTCFLLITNEVRLCLSFVVSFIVSKCWYVFYVCYLEICPIAWGYMFSNTLVAEILFVQCKVQIYKITTFFRWAYIHFNATYTTPLTQRQYSMYYKSI